MFTDDFTGIVIHKTAGTLQGCCEALEQDKRVET